MQELNLEVGQKCWSIQLGECEVVEIDENAVYPVLCKDRNGISQSYKLNGNYDDGDFAPSLFLSNPFDSQSVKSNDMVEDKAALINALRMVYKDCPDTDLKIISKRRLKKLLESL